MIMENFISGGKIEFHPNANYATFHMRHELMPHDSWHSTGSMTRDKWKDSDPYLTGVLVKDLMKIPGVKKVTVSPYEISIEKAQAFTFPQLIPAIKLSMAKYLPSRYS